MRLPFLLLLGLTWAAAPTPAGAQPAALPPGRGPALPPPPRPFPPAFQVDRDSPWQRTVEGRLVPKSSGVFHGRWGRWTNSLLLQATSAPVDVVVAPEAAGRILRFSLNNENVLHDPGTETPVGGHYCDLGFPPADGPVRAFFAAARQGWSSQAGWRVEVRSGRDPGTGLEIQKTLRLDPETGTLHLTQWLVNRRTAEARQSLRDHTRCPGGGFVLFPLRAAGRSRFAAGWALQRKAGDTLSYDGTTPFSPRVRVLDGVLVAQAAGDPVRLGADTDAGWVAYARGRVLFVKFFAHEKEGDYGDDGLRLEVAWDKDTVAVDPLSPRFVLARHHPQAWLSRWVLLPLAEPVTSFDQARSLAERIHTLQRNAGRLEMAALTGAMAKTALPPGEPIP
ncbi:MAG: hypothetical protein RJA22_2259 [Verrucomicrobiota bacterium]|jgi:hypothetical protein